jgi:hypothetical protein
MTSTTIPPQELLRSKLDLDKLNAAKAAALARLQTKKARQA